MEVTMEHIPSPDCPCKPTVIATAGQLTILHKKAK